MAPVIPAEPGGVPAGCAVASCFFTSPVCLLPSEFNRRVPFRAALPEMFTQEPASRTSSLAPWRPSSLRMSSGQNPSVGRETVTANPVALTPFSSQSSTKNLPHVPGKARPGRPRPLTLSDDHVTPRPHLLRGTLCGHSGSTTLTNTVTTALYFPYKKMKCPHSSHKRLDFCSLGDTICQLPIKLTVRPSAFSRSLVIRSCVSPVSRPPEFSEAGPQHVHQSKRKTEPRAPPSTLSPDRGQTYTLKNSH